MSLTQELKEKTFSFWGRMALRAMAWLILSFYMVFRIMIPLISKERVVLDQNDGYVIAVCMALLLAIEAVKAATEKWLSKKTQ